MAFRKTSKKASKKAFKKVAAKKKRGKTAESVKLPDGYRTIGRAPNWDIEKYPMIEGVRGPAKDVTLYAGTKQEKDTRVITVITKDLGALSVWESAGLTDLFDGTDDGDTVRIEYVETLEPRKKGQQGMRVFSCSVKE